jgi:hypothetical protein
MAREFPQCDVVGLDLTPAPIDIELLPPNCHFEIDDINLGLSHYHGLFDLIHVRCIGSGVSFILIHYPHSPLLADAFR